METFYLTLFGATLLVFLGNLIGRFAPALRRFALPGAVIGGLIGLVAGPQLLGKTGWPLLAPEQIDAFYSSLRRFPGLFITVVFACLMLGRRFEPARTIWARAKPQIVMGHLFAWGQYMVGLALAGFALEPLFGVSELAGPLIAIGFQGGHGTAAGLGSSFAELGFSEGEDLALAVATVGVLAGVVGGPFLANALKRRHEGMDTDAETNEARDEEADSPQRFEPNPLTGRLTVHFALVGIVVVFGWLALEGLGAVEGWLRGATEGNYVTDYVPLFSIVLLVGMAAQAFLQWVGWDGLFDRLIFERISAFALDMVIVGALATLSLSALGDYWAAILALCLVGLGWNLALFFLVGPKVYRQPWYAYGLGDLGGGTATTASGIMLINVVDPQKKTGALKAYADKQPFYEPLMGGGLVTALALPTMALLGVWPSFGIVVAILTFWAALAWRLARR